MSNEDLTNAAIPLIINDKEYSLSRLNDRDLSELNEWVRGEYIKMARISLNGEIDANVRRETLEIAIGQAAGISWMRDKGAQLMSTPDGLARIVYQAIKRRHPSSTYEEIRALMLDPDNVLAVKETLQRIKPKAPQVRATNTAVKKAAKKQPKKQKN